MEEVGSYDFSALVAEKSLEISDSAYFPQVVSNSTVILCSGSLIALIDVYKEEAGQSNELGEHKDELLVFSRPTERQHRGIISRDSRRRQYQRNFSGKKLERRVLGQIDSRNAGIP